MQENDDFFLIKKNINIKDKNRCVNFISNDQNKHFALPCSGDSTFEKLKNYCIENILNLVKKIIIFLKFKDLKLWMKMKV